MSSLLEIVSGGQTGADRAALDWAIDHAIPHGGWCPTGRIAEDGVIPDRYQLIEMPDGGGYRQRTRANVQNSDATLIVSLAAVLTGGSLETARFADRLRKPWLHLHPGQDWKSRLQNWMRGVPVRTLNVAGPRASREADVAAFAREVLDEVLRITTAASGAPKSK